MEQQPLEGGAFVVRKQNARVRARKYVVRRHNHVLVLGAGQIDLFSSILVISKLIFIFWNNTI